MSLIAPTTCKEKRKQLNDFYKTVAEARPDLFRFCRQLTQSPWDAEDLAQETLMIAYGRLADKHAGIENVKSYLFKIASNQWITWCRRNRLHSEHNQHINEPLFQNEPLIAQDSLRTLYWHLPPKERVAFVLSEVFESKNEEIAAILGSTEGAVKSALLRAREKLKSLPTQSSPLKKIDPGTDHHRILNLAVEAFNRRELETFAKLFATNAVSQAPGCFFETGIEEIKKGSLFYTFNTHEGTPQPDSMRARLVHIGGEPFFALFDGEVLDDIWKFTIEDGVIVRFDCYFCCPDVLKEAAEILGKTASNHGYWFEQNFQSS